MQRLRLRTTCSSSPCIVLEQAAGGSDRELGADLGFGRGELSGSAFSDDISSRKGTS
jgi:hypothetical protein